MNPKLPLAHFNRISDAPDAIARLRRFIFDLAVRGKLVEQDSSDEPASELLKRIDTEKDRLVKDGKLKKLQSFPTVELDEEPFDIPEKWSWTRLGAIGLTQTGTTPSKTIGHHFGNHIPFIKPGDIYQNEVDYANEGLSDAGLIESGRIAQSGSLLMVCIGTIGKCQVIDRDCSFNQQINSLSPYGSLCSRYLFVACCSEYFQKSAWKASARTTISILNKGKWELLLLPIPPLAEQHRIVAKVDELMALCDRLDAATDLRERQRDRLTAASLHRLNKGTDAEGIRNHAHFYLNLLPKLTVRPDQVAGLRQTILGLAVTGKLTSPQKGDGSGDEELRELDSKKIGLALRKAKTVAEVSAEEQWCQLPSNWVWTRWDRITDWITYGFTRPMPHASEGVPIVTGKNVNFGKIILSSAHRTTESAYKGLNDKDRPRKWDILLTKDGSIGRSAIVETDEPFCINQSVAVLWLRSCHFDRRFLQLAIDCPQTQQELLAKTEGVAIKHISIIDFGQMAFPLPPLAEQHRIVAAVNKLMALCNQLEEGLRTVHTDSCRLLEAVLHQALSAKLNAQTVV